MSKRYTDTDKYKKKFIRGLPGAYKLLWDYIYLDCNHAGIWIVDFEVTQIYLGSDMLINKKTALELFNKRKKKIIEFSNNEKWFIPSFVDFQYGELNPINQAHKSVITILEKYNLTNDPLIKIKTLISPLGANKDKDKDKDKDLIKNIVDFLNKLLGTKYKASSEKTKKCIKARINEGYTFENFKTVITKKHAKWFNTDQAQYLRPETLFGNKFEGYLNEFNSTQPTFNSGPRNTFTDD